GRLQRDVLPPVDRHARPPRRPPHVIYGDAGAGRRPGPRIWGHFGSSRPPRPSVLGWTPPVARRALGRPGPRGGPVRLQPAGVVHGPVRRPRERDRRPACREDLARLLLGRRRRALSARPTVPPFDSVVREGMVNRQADPVWPGADAVGLHRRALR